MLACQLARKTNPVCVYMYSMYRMYRVCIVLFESVCYVCVCMNMYYNVYACIICICMYVYTYMSVTVCARICILHVYVCIDSIVFICMYEPVSEISEDADTYTYIQ